MLFIVAHVKEPCPNSALEKGVETEGVKIIYTLTVHLNITVVVGDVEI